MAQAQAQSKVASVVQDAVAQSVASKQAEEEDEDDLPLFYTDVLEAVINHVRPRAPERTFKFMKTSPENLANRRLKGWRPVDDPDFINRIMAGFSGRKELITNGGCNVQLGNMQLWMMNKSRAEKIRKRNSERASARRAEVKSQLEGDLSDIHGRSRGLVTPLIPKE